MESSNLWILTEERPKREVLCAIIKKFAEDNGISFFVEQNLFIVPILELNENFAFGYQILGIHSAVIKNVFLFVVSGNSSFVDFLVFYQNNKPDPSSDIPLYAIEETKTSDCESRNTGVFQRASKFVFIDLYYRGVKKIMLYSTRVGQSKSPSKTNEFGSRCLATLGIQILGKSLDDYALLPFSSIEELIEFRKSMRRPPAGNTPISIEQNDNKITISGRLEKSGTLSHDPNIGAISLISATLRSLGFDGRIEIVSHGLSQENVGESNKFVSIANSLGIELKNIKMPLFRIKKDYWHYEERGEKNATIFLHLIIEEFTRARAIYENHAGCERGYFITRDNDHLVVGKYEDREEYKNGNKNAKIFIPDLVLDDFDRKQVINIEGKKFIKVQCGISELENYDAFEKLYVKKYYKDYEIVRTVVLFGGEIDEITTSSFPEISSIDIPKIGFVLTKDGKIILQIHSPKVFAEAISHLRRYYGFEREFQ